jgi:hypothetical protein
MLDKGYPLDVRQRKLPLIILGLAFDARQNLKEYCWLMNINTISSLLTLLPPPWMLGLKLTTRK